MNRKQFKSAGGLAIILVAFITLFVKCTSFEKEETKDTSKPDSTRFTKMILAEGLDEPMTMEILPGNDVLFVERKGGVRFYDNDEKTLKTIGHINVFSGIEDGLLGLAVDPNYEKNNWIYLYYSVKGDEAINRLARLELKAGILVTESEKVLLEFPTQRQYCCHSAGAMVFDSEGLLYLATGDNTNAEAAEGYVPVDERVGHELADVQATAANSNDLRGKILRLKPLDNGSYAIPEGNLFPADGSEGRPEIYVMGSRNPYRISVDAKTGYLYWGDVGPYTKVSGKEGTLSYDEINQARKSGFFGWPYFLGENEAFPLYDFETKKEGPPKDPLKPINSSRNNTGIKQLPAAQPAFIWYGRLPSERFPLVGKGGASAMVGPVYHQDLFDDAQFRLPAYYDGKLFIYDWVRRWIMAVEMNEKGDYVNMEPFLEHLDLVAPIDMKFASDGALYILEYGTNWFSKNANARLVRVEYAEGNRNPMAVIEANKLYGTAPLLVNFSAEKSEDYDKGDKLSYEWLINGKKYQGPNVSHKFTSNGSYEIWLTVKDNSGGEGSTSLNVKVGNTPPVVTISSKANQTFYWDNTAFDYRIEIEDEEDKEIDSANVEVHFTYVQYGKDLAAGLIDKPSGTQFIRGEHLVASLDCRACHSLSDVSVGPSYKEIARRYTDKAKALPMLIDKVTKGGAGNWGSREMTPHPDLKKEDVEEMVRYILSVNDPQMKLPLKGTISLDDHLNKGNEGGYVFTASYTDKGSNGIEPLKTRRQINLRSPLVQIEDFDEGNMRIGTITTAFISYARTRNNAYAMYKEIDLANVSDVTYQIQSHGEGGIIELRTDSVDGTLLATSKVPGGEVKDLKTNWRPVKAKLTRAKGKRDLYLVFKNKEAGQKTLFHIDWLYFSK